MSENSEYSKRQSLIHLLKAGKTPQGAAEQLQRSGPWAYKWKARYKQDGWEGLRDKSRRPKRIARQTPGQVKQEILRIRDHLETQAETEPDSLVYIGAHAIYGQLSCNGMKSIPSISTIERILRQAGKTRPRLQKMDEKMKYPHLQPNTLHQLIQVDIVPHYLTGGQSVACFNAIDVASRCPAGKQYSQKRSVDARDFLLHVWGELGLSTYLQMDNESCFSGGYKHPGVIGQVVRLALFVGVQPVFSPVYHPESNCFVERFHQDYSDFVWKKVHLESLAAVRQRSALFFPNYRNSHHHSELKGKSPAELHCQNTIAKLPLGFSIPKRLPITEGQVHFMRKVNKQGKVFILNKSWTAGLGQPEQGVWATLSLKPAKATLRIYDAAPDAPKRRCLAEHPFSLNEPVMPRQTQQQTGLARWQILFTGLFRRRNLTPSTMS